VTERQKALIPAPEQLQPFARIDAKLPAEIVRAAIREAEREYRYALIALICGATSFALVIGAFVYRVETGHGTAAAGLLGAGLLGVIGSFIRARLRS
jgi:hypothetical protein